MQHRLYALARHELTRWWNGVTGGCSGGWRAREAVSAQPWRALPPSHATAAHVSLHRGVQHAWCLQVWRRAPGERRCSWVTELLAVQVLCACVLRN